MRIGVASWRHQLRVSRVISFHRLLNCARKTWGAIWFCSSFQRTEWVSPPLNKCLLSSLKWVIWINYWCHCLQTNLRGAGRPFFILLLSSLWWKRQSPTRPQCPWNSHQRDCSALLREDFDARPTVPFHNEVVKLYALRLPAINI